MYISGPSQHSSDTLPRWTQRILVSDPHGAARGRGGGGDLDAREDGGDLTARDSFIMRRAKTDLTHERSSGTVGAAGGGGIGRSRLPIFVSNENARIWLDSQVCTEEPHIELCYLLKIFFVINWFLENKKNHIIFYPKH